jgi:hypothetical protein
VTLKECLDLIAYEERLDLKNGRKDTKTFYTEAEVRFDA